MPITYTMNATTYIPREKIDNDDNRNWDSRPTVTLAVCQRQKRIDKDGKHDDEDHVLLVEEMETNNTKDERQTVRQQPTVIISTKCYYNNTYIM